MKVDRIDRNYASTSFGSPIDYGTAKDKFAEHEDMTKRDCGPQGHFQIDTSKTGVIFDPQVSFKSVHLVCFVGPYLFIYLFCIYSFLWCIVLFLV